MQLLLTILLYYHQGHLAKVGRQVSAVLAQQEILLREDGLRPEDLQPENRRRRRGRQNEVLRQVARRWTFQQHGTSPQSAHVTSFILKPTYLCLPTYVYLPMFTYLCLPT